MKKKLFIVLERGSGKSLIYMLPRLLELYGKTCRAHAHIVVVPLVALMGDV